MGIGIGFLRNTIYTDNLSISASYPLFFNFIVVYRGFIFKYFHRSVQLPMSFLSDG